MNNDELKKRVIEIALTELQVQFGCGDTVEVGDREACAESIADALIAAEFVDKGDYASMKETAVKYKAEVSKAENRAKEAEHRAKIAERALKDVCTNVITDEEDDLAIEPRARVLYKAYLKQAEEELPEERKDED